MMTKLLILVLSILFVSALPESLLSASWGSFPSGIIGFALVIPVVHQMTG